MSLNRPRAKELTDKAQILDYLQRDRLYAAYAIGDLEPDLFAQSRWVGVERSGQLHALGLLFRGLDPPALFLMGSLEGLQVLLKETLFPPRVYFTCLPGHLAVTRVFYDWEVPIAMWRMVLNPERFRAEKGDCVRLTPGDANELSELYAEDEQGGTGFSENQVEQGIFYGLRVKDQLVAVAGTHLVSETYDVAAVGNIFTRPGYRGRGYATVATSAVVAELIEGGIGDIVLNVGQDNLPAIRIYEKLGFERYCAFYEGIGKVRGGYANHPNLS